MCYSALVRKDLKKLEKQYGAEIAEKAWNWIYQTSKDDPKKFKLATPQGRIFPNYWAPIIHQQDDQKNISPMRYSTFIPEFINAPKNYTSFNARRDNLTSRFWSDSFMVHHGILILEGFYEWVAVKDLLKAGVVTIEQVKAEFDRQTEERKKRILSQGKTYKPTKTEQKDPRFRDIVIRFTPENHQVIKVPVIFNVKQDDSGQEMRGFALITDQPPPEVLRAGHDRVPINLNDEGCSQWLMMGSRQPLHWQNILDLRDTEVFSHRLAEAA